MPRLHALFLSIGIAGFLFVIDVVVPGLLAQTFTPGDFYIYYKPFLLAALAPCLTSLWEYEWFASLSGRQALIKGFTMFVIAFYMLVAALVCFGFFCLFASVDANVAQLTPTAAEVISNSSTAFYVTLFMLSGTFFACGAYSLIIEYRQSERTGG